MSEERITILDDISEIVCVAKGCGLDENFIQRGPACGRIKALSERLDISPCQSVLLALLVEHSVYEALSLHDMAEYFGVQAVPMLQKLDALEDLEAHGYLSSQMEEGQMLFRVPWQELHSFAYDMVYSPKEGTPQETEHVIITLFSLFNYYLAPDSANAPISELRAMVTFTLDETDLPLFHWLRNEVPSEWPIFGIVLYLLCCEYFRRWEYCSRESLAKLLDGPQKGELNVKATIFLNDACYSKYIKDENGVIKIDGRLWLTAAHILDL